MNVNNCSFSIMADKMVLEWRIDNINICIIENFNQKTLIHTFSCWSVSIFIIIIRMTREIIMAHGFKIRSLAIDAKLIRITMWWRCYIVVVFVVSTTTLMLLLKQVFEFLYLNLEKRLAGNSHIEYTVAQSLSQKWLVESYAATGWKSLLAHKK